jgi:hypothetical protein
MGVIREHAVRATPARNGPTHDALNRVVSVTCVAVVLAIGVPGLAAAQSSADASDGWQFEIEPYLWLSGVKSDTGVGPLPATHIDMKFSDVFKCSTLR